MIDFSSFSLLTNVGLFTVGALTVWLSGTKITHLADRISRRWGLGQAAAGVLILAGITSLPEVATSFAAAHNGNAPLAVTNLLGSIALQIALLGLADLVFDKRALTSIVPDPIVMLQGAIHVCLLTGVAIAILVPDRLFFGAGLW
ncbi:MAG: sodium:calcium antiporter, partial [Gammaproteobacteria bacterium]